MRSNSELFARMNEANAQTVEQESRAIARKVFLEVLLDCRDLLVNLTDRLAEKGRTK